MGNDLERPQLIGVSHLGITVTDLDRSLRCYCDVLGAPLVRPPYSEIVCRSPVVWQQWRSDQLRSICSSTQPTAESGLSLHERVWTTWAFAAASSKDLQAWANQLDASDVPHSAIREVVGVGEIFDFVDPDGIRLEFMFLDFEKLSQFDAATVSPDK